MKQIEDVVRDRGSRYAVSGGPVQSRAGVDGFLTDLKRAKKYAKATHNTWAVVLSDGGAVKNDDGESGAGAVILKMLERAGLVDHIVVVTRWYGGGPLGGGRFAPVGTSVGGHAEDSDSRGAALWQYRKMVVAGLGCGLGHRKIPATMDGCEHSLGRAGLFFGPEQRRTGLDPCAGSVGAGGGTGQHRAGGNRRSGYLRATPASGQGQGLRFCRRCLDGDCGGRGVAGGAYRLGRWRRRCAR